MQNLPRHIAFIMDGNGRWAAERGLSRSKGHKEGVKTLKKIIQAAFERGIEIVSIYAFSSENWNRPKDEIDELFGMLEDFVRSNLKDMKDREARLSIMGDITKLPNGLQNVLNEAIKKTADGDKHTLNLGLNYGSHPEIIRAVNNIIKSGIEEVSVETFKDFLYTAGMPDPDFIVRTSGEKRLSNFMLFQAAYSEFYFPDVFWPAFDERELDKALEEYSLRKRRFGAIV